MNKNLVDQITVYLKDFKYKIKVNKNFKSLPIFN